MEKKKTTKKTTDQPVGTGTVKTRDEYYNDVYGKAKTAVDEQYAARTAADEATKAKINEAIDKATKAGTDRYQTQIDNAPRESRVQFDQNAVRDAVAKKQVQERLANMGVTDSGLNSSMQTALAIQKQRADNTVRSEERAKIQAAQDAINQLLAQGDSQKAEQGMAVDQKTADWYNGVLAQLPTTAYGMAGDAYSFDKSMENEEIARRWNAEQAQIARDWQAGEADKNRDFTTSEREKEQEWSESQNDYARIAKEYQAIQERKNAIGKAKNTISSETYFNNNAYKNPDGSFEFEDEVFKDYKDYVIWKLQRQYNEGNLDEEALYELFNEYGIS